MPAKLCVTVTGRTMAELRERRDRVRDADLVELRVDSVSDPDAAGALEGRRLPVVFTCRAAWEGGGFAGPEEDRRRILEDALRLGAEYVDVEWRANFHDLIEAQRGQRIVLSMHDFAGVPRDLAEIAGAMRRTSAEVVKIAVTSTRLSDGLRLRAIACAQSAPTVVIAMGEAGIASRVLASRFGSAWTYAGDGVAPGQIPASTMLERYNFRGIDERTAIYGVVGRPVSHSISPDIHNAAFRAVGLNAVYLALAAEDFADFLEFANGLPLAGASVTAPFKLAACAYADDVDPASRRVGAVNTLKRRLSGWAACNTDTAGFLAPLAQAIDLAGQRATVLGAGGAARAAVDGLTSAGATVTVCARRRDQAETLARATGVASSDWPPSPGSWDVLVNTTPVGTVPNSDETPIPGAPFTGKLVYDLVYNPADTRLLREARAAGCATLGGLEMLIAQAGRQFTWWTGAEPPRSEMRAAAERALHPHRQR